uniref:Uncharacterized protein n=1 Tax=Alexandrium monilatum TaxID=311494 RepID=A0A7S4QAE8_9DINO
MPPHEEIEAQLASVLAAERHHTAKRLARERARVDWIAKDAERQVATAAVQANATVAQAKADAHEAVARAEERFRAEQERCAAEIRAAEARAAAAREEALRRVRAAEAEREAARPGMRARVDKAEQARQQAVSVAQASADEAEAFARARKEEASRRKAAAEARAAQMKADVENRETRRIEEAEHRADALEREARGRLRLAHAQWFCALARMGSLPQCPRHAGGYRWWSVERQTASTSTFNTCGTGCCTRSGSGRRARTASTTTASGRRSRRWKSGCLLVAWFLRASSTGRWRRSRPLTRSRLRLRRLKRTGVGATARPSGQLRR